MKHTALEVRNLTAGYNADSVLKGIDLDILPSSMSAIIGANACGKSTLLRAILRLLVPQSGEVLLDGIDIHTIGSKQLAQQLGFLPQAPLVPDGITVLDLVSRGRHPYQGFLTKRTTQDEAAVAQALALTGTEDLIDRDVTELSGGQRQKVWIAMALAQQTDVLLLDEPTSYLDINHQIDVLDLLAQLNRRQGTTIVMVLHDLNLAARYCDHLIAMKDGRIFLAGTAEEVLTTGIIREVFGVESVLISDPLTGRPMMIPRSRHGNA